MIEVSDLNVSYGDFEALKSISFDVATGECLVVTGMSGCGKTTLARVLTGLIPHAIPASISGKIVVAGIDPIAQATSESARKIGSVFQNPRTHLFHLRVEDEVAFGPHNLGLSTEETKLRVDWALNAVGLDTFHRRNPSSLSGGQMQRLAIAAALAMRPQVLVLDEPTASLDVEGTQSVIEVLKLLQVENKLTIVIIEHRLAELRKLANKVLVLDQGCMVAYGDFDEVLDDHALLHRYGLRRPTIEPLAAWEDLLFPEESNQSEGEALLTMKNVSAGYEGEEVISDVDMTIYRQEFVALVGDNGSGKSTLALTAAGLLRPIGGRIIFQGKRRPLPGLDVALLFQDPSDQLFTDSVDEEVAFGPCNFNQFDQDKHNQTLSHLDLNDLKSRHPIVLSMGQQQRTALAACLALRPQLVILDEPTLGQDWWHLEQLMEFLQELNEQGTAILLITHDFKLVHRYAQRVILIQDGRLKLSGQIRRPSQFPFLSGVSEEHIDFAS